MSEIPLHPNDTPEAIREQLRRFCERYAYQTRHGTEMAADLVLDELCAFVHARGGS